MPVYRVVLIPRAAPPPPRRLALPDRGSDGAQRRVENGPPHGSTPLREGARLAELVEQRDGLHPVEEVPARQGLQAKVRARPDETSQQHRGVSQEKRLYPGRGGVRDETWKASHNIKQYHAQV